MRMLKSFQAAVSSYRPARTPWRAITIIQQRPAFTPDGFPPELDYTPDKTGLRTQGGGPGRDGHQDREAARTNPSLVLDAGVSPWDALSHAGAALSDRAFPQKRMGTTSKLRQSRFDLMPGGLARILAPERETACPRSSSHRKFSAESEKRHARGAFKWGLVKPYT